MIENKNVLSKFQMKELHISLIFFIYFSYISNSVNIFDIYGDILLEIVLISIFSTSFLFVIIWSLRKIN